MATTYKYVFNPFTGNFDEVVNTIDASDITGGSALSVAGFDSTGTLGSIPGFNYTTENGLDQDISVDMANNATDYFEIDINPTANTTGIFKSAFTINVPLDNANTGFNMGDASGGGANAFNVTLDRQNAAGGQSGDLSIINVNSTIGDGTGAQVVHSYTAQDISTHLAAGSSITTNYTGLGVFPAFDAGSTLDNATLLNTNPTFNGTATGFLTTLGIFPNFGAASITAHYHAIENGGDGNTTAVITEYINYNGYLNNASIGNMTGIQFNPNNVAISGSLTLARFSPGGTTTIGDDSDLIDINGTATVASGKNIRGINLSMNGFTSDQQKQALNIDGGALNVQSPYDTSVLSASPGEFQQNIIGGQLTIAAGHPMTNTFGFGNNLASTALIQDDMGPDPTGVGIGYTMVGFVGNISVASGKTADTINMAIGGAGIPTQAGDGGTITNATMYKAIGFLNEGGNLSVTNMKAFEVSPNLSAYSTNVWGLYIADTNANNWLAKNMIIGGVTGLPTGAFALDVTGDSSIVGTLSMNSNFIHNVTDPVAPQDAATKAYVDASLSSNIHSFNTQSGTTYTFVLADGSQTGTMPIVSFTNASAVTATVPPNSSVAFPIGTEIDLIQSGAGRVTVAPGAGVTIDSNGSNLSLLGQYTSASLIKTATNTWILTGSIGNPFISATGGTITTNGNFRIHTFTTNGTFSVTNAPSGTSLNYLIVGGGGGGGVDAGVGTGGGGGGGFLTATGYAASIQNYSIIVGDGGLRGSASQGANGGVSSFDGNVALGGGGGAANGSIGQNGGSGGGGTGTGTGARTAGTGSQGFNGGIGATDLASYSNGGGGGGASMAGVDASPTNGGNGGDGASSSISGTSTPYAGGGGGGTLTGTGGTGGSGGGGMNNVSGTANTGGGGGGGAVGGDGGSGIVIISYQFQ